MFQWNFKWVSRVFGGSFQVGSRLFLESFKGVSRKIEIEGVIQRSFKVSKRSSRQFQRCFKEDSSVLKKVSSVFQENFIKGFKGTSRIFL